MLNSILDYCNKLLNVVNMHTDWEQYHYYSKLVRTTKSGNKKAEGLTAQLNEWNCGITFDRNLQLCLCIYNLSYKNRCYLVLPQSCINDVFHVNEYKFKVLQLNLSSHLVKSGVYAYHHILKHHCCRIRSIRLKYIYKSSISASMVN